MITVKYKEDCLIQSFIFCNILYIFQKKKCRNIILADEKRVNLWLPIIFIIHKKEKEKTTNK